MKPNTATAKKTTPSAKIMHSKNFITEVSIDFPPHSSYVYMIIRK